MAKVTMDRDLAAKTATEINTLAVQGLQKAFADGERTRNVKLYEAGYLQAIEDVKRRHPGIDI